MKIAAAVTLDGMIRALKWRSHGLAERRERDMIAEPARLPRYPSPRPFSEEDRIDDRRSR